MGQNHPAEISRLTERYYSILERLEKDFPFVLQSVYNLGKPSFSGVCTTACVGIDELSQDLFYDWNADFFSSLNDEEVGFVVLHETLHILLNHIGKTTQSLNQQQWNIACDIVINDWLNLELINGKHIKCIKAPKKLMTGQGVLKINCSLKYYTAEKIYTMLQQKSTDPSGFSFTPVDEHDTWLNIPSEVAEKVKDALSKSPEVKNAIGRGLLPGSCREVADDVQNKFNLNKMIKHIIATKTEESYHENWRRYNIKLASVYPAVILPYITMNESKGKLSLLFAVDVSGSMSKQLISEMIAIAKNHELDHDVTAIQFDTKVHPLDLDKKQLYGRGGTSFQSVVDYIAKSDENYDIIVVLTDGYGGTINDKQIEPHKWFWGITTSCNVSKSYGTIFRIPPEYITNRKR